MYLDGTLHFHPSGETDYQVERSAQISIEHAITNPNIRVQTDETKQGEFSRYPHYQLVLPLESPERIRKFAEELKEAAEKIENDEYEESVPTLNSRDIKEKADEGDNQS